MSHYELLAVPLSRSAFRPFGDVIETAGGRPSTINQGWAERYCDLAQIDVTAAGGRPLLDLVQTRPRALPMSISMVERHALGSQAFIPLSPRPFLVVVCHDAKDGPGEPHAFLAGPGQGINYRRNLWHGVLTPIGEAQDFLIVDRGGDGSNLEECHFSHPYEIHLP